MPGVRVKENEPFEVALKRFKKQCEKAGILSEIRKREYYEKPSVRRKRKLVAARKKALTHPQMRLCIVRVDLQSPGEGALGIVPLFQVKVNMADLNVENGQTGLGLLGPLQQAQVAHLGPPALPQPVQEIEIDVIGLQLLQLFVKKVSENSYLCRLNN